MMNFDVHKVGTALLAVVVAVMGLLQSVGYVSQEQVDKVQAKGEQVQEQVEAMAKELEVVKDQAKQFKAVIDSVQKP